MGDSEGWVLSDLWERRRWNSKDRKPHPDVHPDVYFLLHALFCLSSRSGQSTNSIAMTKTHVEPTCAFQRAGKTSLEALLAQKSSFEAIDLQFPDWGVGGNPEGPVRHLVAAG